MSMTATPPSEYVEYAETPSHIAAEVMSRLAFGVLAMRDHAFDVQECRGDADLDAELDLDVDDPELLDDEEEALLCGGTGQ